MNMNGLRGSSCKQKKEKAAEACVRRPATPGLEKSVASSELSLRKDRKWEPGNPQKKLDMAYVKYMQAMCASRHLDDKIERMKSSAKVQLELAMAHLQEERSLLGDLEKRTRDVCFHLEQDRILESLESRCISGLAKRSIPENMLELIRGLGRNKYVLPVQGIHIESKAELSTAVQDTLTVLRKIGDVLDDYMDPYQQLAEDLSSQSPLQDRTNKYIQEFLQAKPVLQSSVLLELSRRRSDELVEELRGADVSEASNLREVNKFFIELSGKADSVDYLLESHS